MNDCTKKMKNQRILRVVAGFFVVLSVALGVGVSSGFLWFTLFVGINLFQSGFTEWCPLLIILDKINKE